MVHCDQTNLTPKHHSKQARHCDSGSKGYELTHVPPSMSPRHRCPATVARELPVRSKGECEVDHTTSPRPLHPGKLDRRVSCKSRWFRLGAFVGRDQGECLASSYRRGAAPRHACRPDDPSNAYPEYGAPLWWWEKGQQVHAPLLQSGVNPSQLFRQKLKPH